MQIQDLNVYPVKSLRGIALDEAEVLQRGFKFDRRWMLTDAGNTFITQRTEHRLSGLKTEIAKNGIRISHSAAADLLIPFTIHSSKRIKVKIWDDETEAMHYQKEADQWFSEFLDKECKLVHLPENGFRPVDPRYALNQENVSFADAFPYLLISQGSLDDLNSRLQIPVPMNRFRPNIVISGCDAFAEDTWDEITVGEVSFKVAKPCARCVLTTVDQETGIKGKEPLATLASYRTQNTKVLFGQNLIALNEGKVGVGDHVKILKYK